MSAIHTANKMPWFHPLAMGSSANQDLFVFPHAGGGIAMFRNWPSHLPPSVRVNALQLAGRESRYHEPPTSDWTEVVRGASAAIAGRATSLPLLFGHSMGAMLAFEVARDLKKSYGVETGALMVSGRPAPQLSGRTPSPGHLSDQSLLEKLSLLYGGIPAAVLKDGEMVRMMARVLRADLTLVERYRFAAGDPLTCPIAAFGGVQDPWATREELHAWSEVTSADFSLELLPGGHFYLKDDPTERLLLRSISSMCSSIASHPSASADTLKARKRQPG